MHLWNGCMGGNRILLYPEDNKTIFLFFLFLKQHGVKHLYGHISGIKKTSRLLFLSYSDKQCGKQTSPLQTLLLHLPTSQSCQAYFCMIINRMENMSPVITNTTNTMRQQVYLQDVAPQTKTFGTEKIRFWSPINFLEQ